MDINKPRFELTSIYNDGSVKEPKIVPVTEMPWDTNINRRGFLGTGLLAGTLLTLLGKTSLSSTPALNSSFYKNFEGNTLNAHCDVINEISISPDGKLLASASDDNRIKLWSLSDGKLLEKLKDNAAFNSLAFSPDGTMLVSGSKLKTIKFWSLPNGDLKKTVKKDEIINYKVLVSHDGKIVAATSIDGRVNLWSLPQGKLLNSFKLGSSPIKNLVLITPDSKMLVCCGSFDNTPELWSFPEGNLLKKLEGHSGKVNALLVSPNGKILVSASNDNSIKLWTLPEGNLLKTIKGHFNGVNVLSIGIDGQILISGSQDKKIKLWSFPQGDLLKTLEGHTGEIYSLALTQSGKTLVSISMDMTIKLWSIPEGLLLHSFSGSFFSAGSLALSPDGKILAIAEVQGKTIRLFNLERKELTGFLLDKACSETNGVMYDVYDKVTGTTITYTLPCGSPIPSGAVCTCNCVSGTYKPPPVYQYPSNQYCTCNQVCTCVPICQAHKLLHPDKFVRALSREILLFMGVKEIEYMNWAAKNSKLRLRTVITSLINEVMENVKPNYQNWPAVAACKPYLNHDDDVVSVMAAQMIDLQLRFNKQVIPQGFYRKVELLLAKSKEMDWKIKERKTEILLPCK